MTDKPMETSNVETINKVLLDKDNLLEKGNTSVFDDDKNKVPTPI